MESITKSKLSNEQILKMAKHAFGNSVTLESISELADGYYNSAYKLVFKDDSKIVLKVSPNKDVKVMRYEKSLMEAEVHTLDSYKSIGDVPVPKVLFYEKSSNIIDNQYFFMEYIKGMPLNKLNKNLTEDQRISIGTEIGSIVRRLHSLQGDYFGYISQEDKRFKTWPEAFLYMIKELMEDASDMGVELPYGYDRLYELINEKQDVLNLVRTPVLVHKDLWQGNIFVDPETLKITGIVDCERAIYGDPLLEPVFGFLISNESFMESYLGETVFRKEEQVRITLYKVYLNLIMIIECYYRHYPDNVQEVKARDRLEKVLEDLKGPLQN